MDRTKMRSCRQWLAAPSALSFILVDNFFMSLNMRYDVRDAVRKQKPTDEQWYLVDSTEQMLIHLLGRNVLMNSQPGGDFRYYMPDPQSESCIKKPQLYSVRDYFTDITIGNDNEEQLEDIKHRYTTLHENLKNMGASVSCDHPNGRDANGTWIYKLSRKACMVNHSWLPQTWSYPIQYKI